MVLAFTNFNPEMEMYVRDKIFIFLCILCDVWPANIYLFKVNYRNIRKTCEIYSKVNNGTALVPLLFSFEHISHISFVCWLWAGKYFLVNNMYWLKWRIKQTKKVELTCIGESHMTFWAFTDCPNLRQAKKYRAATSKTKIISFPKN